MLILVLECVYCVGESCIKISLLSITVTESWCAPAGLFFHKKSLFISSPCEAESGLSGFKIILLVLQRVSEPTGLCRERTGVLKNSSDVTS